ncbi:MAG: hypothetical protein ACREIA_16090 [Opitutaceae bacterium]
MKTTARSIISGAVLIGLLAFLGYAITTQGLASDPALLAFSFIALYGLVKIAIISYAPPPSARGRMKLTLAPRSVELIQGRHPVPAARPALRRARASRSGVPAA